LKFDTLVLGAGIVGVSVACHLQMRGQSIALIDLNEPGSETSSGNGGLIQAEAVYPYAFPRELSKLLSFARNNTREVRYHLTGLLQFSWPLFCYWRNSHPERHAQIAREYAPLIRNSVAEHLALASSAGALGLFRSGGWLRAFRTDQQHDQFRISADKCRREFGVNFEDLDTTRLRALEPDLNRELVGALRYPEAQSVLDPQALVRAYAKYFASIGGSVFVGDAETLSGEWSLVTAHGPIKAPTIVVALGPWADSFLRKLGYALPLFVKRGYHMHYAAQSGSRLNHSVLDTERGYLLAPMAKGIRLTTGVELARRDARSTPTQLAAVEPIARTFFPLGERIDPAPWKGARPCTPDMKPVIGPAPGRKDLWFALGHAHQGLTLGPVSGRLLAEMMTGEEPLTDPNPFRVDRF
jgi:D-amino-acid dehydrogenase